MADFTSQNVSEHVIRISDPLAVHMYLVVGDRAAVLIDSGHGVGDLGTFVRGLVGDRPVTVLLTHGHMDHAFGASWFEDVRLNSADRPVLEEHRPVSAEVLADAARQGSAVAAPPDPASLKGLSGGESFDVGGVVVTTVEAPGHTPGSMAMLVSPDRLLVTGDAANQFTFLFLPESSSVHEYAGSLASMAATAEGAYDRVLISHGTGEIGPDVLRRLQLLCEKVEAGTDDAVPFTFMGMEGRVARSVAGPELHDDDPNLVYRLT